MCRGVAVALVGMWAMFFLTPPLVSQDRDPLVGKRVMVTRWNANLKVGTKTVGSLRMGSLITVSKVSGDWLWIKNARGWIERKNVVPVDQAIAHFSAAINRNRSAEAYHQRAVAYMALKQFDKALADLNLAITRESGNVAAYNDRGNVYRNLGQPKRAIAEFDKVIARNVRHPAIYTNRGLAWHDAGDNDRALADYNAAIKIDAKFVPAWEAAGSARQAKAEYASAMRNFQHAITLNPKFLPAYNNLAWLLSTCPSSEHRDGKKAVEYATKACELTNFQDAGMLDTLAAALAESGRFEEAVKRATTAVELAGSPKKEAIRMRLALYKKREPYRDTH